ncbi:hypothetical protein HGRIS_011934 [Hohenbuehelia grisea]|uniref:Uncharacterized protein n=1 Tax=Hohenbuehelia grisea TaxID=104357 RepID=A0ABR3JYC2_9AGAR
MFREAWRMVDAILEAASARTDSAVSTTHAEDIVYQMFEANMDEYLDEEVDSIKHTFEVICKGWDKEVRPYPFISTLAHSFVERNHQTAQFSVGTIATSAANSSSTARFLNSQNPAQVKRNVLASFTSVLLLPVTIVPRTVGAVGAVLTTGGSAAAQGIAMLNPQRWGGGAAFNGNGYARQVGQLDKDGGMLFEIGDDDDEGPNTSLSEKEHRQDSPSSSVSQLEATKSPPTSAAPVKEEKFDPLLSLDVCLELIHAER